MPTVNKKDPSGVLEYVNNWAVWLGSNGVEGDTIATSSWTVTVDEDDEDPLVEDSSSHTDTTATVWFSGGTVGNEYRYVNHVTTAGGRTDDRTRTITIANR